ncbi:MAG TPA: YbjN domain-containing protein [Pyrinomonadaceae bacterium]
MGEILDTAISFFNGDGWTFTQLEGRTVLQLSARTEPGQQWNCFAEAREEQSQFIFYSVSPVNAPEERLPDVAEFLTRANYGLIIGNFEMDWTDGEIRCKTSIDVEGDRLTEALVRQLVYANVRLTGRYLPGILALIEGSATPTEAIARIEG